MSDDFISFLNDDELEEKAKDSQTESWLIGIIDDEQSIHDVTKLALKDVNIYGKRIEFVSAYSGEEGYQLLKDNPGIAVVLLDVVMESPEAGLLLVERIRKELNNDLVQIILRTGQAGMAPEEEVIIQYEINAYKTKNELTRQKLFTTIASSLRSYLQLAALEESRQGLRAVIEASSSLILERSIYDFSFGVLKQIKALFDLSASSLFCISQRPKEGPFGVHEYDDGYYIVAAVDKYKHYYGQSLDAIYDELAVFELVKLALDKKENVYNENISVLYLTTPSGWEGIIVAEGDQNLQAADQEILKIFTFNVALGLENAKFFSHLNRAVFHDELTSLYNRAGFLNAAAPLISKAKNSVSVYLVDIDYFHEAVTSLGYDFGNDILNKIGHILIEFFTDESVVARIHSDAFAVLVKDTDLKAEQVSAICSRPIVVNNRSFRMGLTVGLAKSNVNEADAEKLLQRSEIALHVAKETKRGTGEEFSAEFEESSRQSMDMLSDLRLGIDKQELFLVLQPKVNANNNRVTGFEALLRWQHPTKGVIPPEAFINSVEKSGMYYEVDVYVASALALLLEQNPQLTVPVSFNISSSSLKHESFVSDLTNIFKKHKINPSRIEVEVTENAIIQSDRAISQLNSLANSGFKICLDDFGAGYSSLNYLALLPLDVIKIDRAFVADLAIKQNAVLLMQGVINIINSLNKEIVIEGVETEEQLNTVLSMGVSNIQGYIFSKPVSVAEAEKFVVSG